jgi:leader peptidase (prepilin peptidase) / N-methyltransferase
MAQLRHPGRPSRRFGAGNRVAVAAAGAAAVLVAARANEWWLLPALLTWAYVLVAAASCDASTQRIPTRLVRQGTASTAVLLAGGSALAGDWRGLAAATLATLAGWLILGFSATCDSRSSAASDSVT